MVQSRSPRGNVAANDAPVLLGAARLAALHLSGGALVQVLQELEITVTDGDESDPKPA